MAIKNEQSERGYFMKKLVMMFCILSLSIGMTACSGKTTNKENGGEQSLDNSTEIIKNDIGPESAKMLILEQLDQNTYSVEPQSTDKEIAGVKYYAFTVFKQNQAMNSTILVDKFSGELYACDASGNLMPFSESEFASGTLANSGDFSGTFFNEKGTVLLEPADDTSFEFNFTMKSDGGNESISGVARVEGNQATYVEENGFSLTFLLSDGKLTVTESGTNHYPVSAAGIYSSTEE